jgi:hypothetical protein
MAVRKTESRIPQNLQASDLGQAVVAPDGRCALVSFFTSPLATGRENAWVVFVNEPGLAAQASGYEWTIQEGAAAPQVTTSPVGEFSYMPQGLGGLNISVRILDGGAAELARLAMTQAMSRAPDLCRKVRSFGIPIRLR